MQMDNGKLVSNPKQEDIDAGRVTRLTHEEQAVVANLPEEERLIALMVHRYVRQRKLFGRAVSVEERNGFRQGLIQGIQLGAAVRP